MLTAELLKDALVSIRVSANNINKALNEGNGDRIDAGVQEIMQEVEMLVRYLPQNIQMQLNQTINENANGRQRRGDTISGICDMMDQMGLDDTYDM